ncbi:MAG: septum formation family protein [Actinomycetota bacterium]|nr:septum formation family protein [Actinomycetota bacterium]
MKKLLGSLAAVSTLVLTSCASAQDVADTSSERTAPVETSEPTTSTTSTSTTPPTSTSAPTTSEPPTTEPTTSAPTTTTEPQLAGLPKVGNCYDTTKAQFRNQRDGSFPVACSGRHTAETFAVFSVSSFPAPNDINKVWRDCQPRFQRYVGAPATLSKLDLTLILPSDDQVAAGQDWIRCDAIQKEHYNALVGAPRTGSLQASLTSGVPREFRGCVKHWPKVDQAVTFTSCDERHQAQLIPESLFFGPPDAPFPGVETTQRKSKQFCEDVFQTYVPETLNYYYYYPTADSWRSGSHNSTCWALDTQGDGLPPL